MSQTNASLSQPEFSIVISCYYEEKSVFEFHQRLLATIKKIPRSFEIIFVNDGSQDGTFQCLKKIFEGDSVVKTILDLSKNSGQAAALAAGIQQASGRNFVFIDSDLQLDPEELPKLIEQFDQGYDMVTGYRAKRQDPIQRVLFSKMAQWILRRAAKAPIKDFGCTYKVFRGELIRAFQYGPEKKVNFPEVIAKCGRYFEIEVNHKPRKYGKSGWTFFSLVDLFVENFVNTADRLFQFAALINLTFAGLLILRVLVDLIFPFEVIGDMTHGLLLNVMVIFALMNVGLHTLNGELIIRSFRKLQRTPLFVIREKITR